MALGYLISPALQVEDKDGKPLVGGEIVVFRHGTTTPYITWKNFNGDRNPARVALNALGMAVLLADDSQLYDVYCYDRNGVQQWSRLNVSATTGGEGGGGPGSDLSVLRCDAADLTQSGPFVFDTLSRQGEGAYVDAEGHIRLAQGTWHYDITVEVDYSPLQETAETTNLVLYTTLNRACLDFDLSYAHAGTLQLSGIVNADADAVLSVSMGGMSTGMTVSVADCGIFEVAGTSTGWEYYEAGTGIEIDGNIIAVDPETVQGKLTAGEGISIDENNVISVDEGAINEIFPVTYNVTPFNDIYAALVAGKLPVLYFNDPEDIAVKVRRIPMHEYFFGSSRWVSFWEPFVYGGAGASLPPYALYTEYAASYDQSTHVTTWSTRYWYSGKQPDWNESDVNSLAYIRNKPAIPTKTSDLANDSGFITSADLPTVDQTYDASSTNAQSGTAVAEALAEADNLFIAVYGSTTIGEVDTAYAQGKDILCRYNSHGHVYSSQLSSLVSGIYTFTTTDGFSDYEFTLSPDGGTGAWSISSRVIPSGTQLVPEATQSDAGEVLTVDQNGDPTWAPAQAPISAGNGIDITNNVVSAKVDGTSLTFNANGELETIATPQVQSDWAEADPTDVSFIRNKPEQTNLVAGSNITIVDNAQNNTVTISAATVNVPVQDVTIDNVSVVNSQGVAEIPRQVNADWNSSAGASEILNKPSIPVIGTVTL